MKQTLTRKDITMVFTDENGYYSFTGECNGSMGAIGDTAVEMYPEWGVLNRLHLVESSDGVPRHMKANGDYILYSDGIKGLAEFLRISVDKVRHYLPEYDKLVRKTYAIWEKDTAKGTPLRIALDGLYEEVVRLNRKTIKELPELLEVEKNLVPNEVEESIAYCNAPPIIKDMAKRLKTPVSYMDWNGGDKGSISLPLDVNVSGKEYLLCCVQDRIDCIIERLEDDIHFFNPSFLGDFADVEECVLECIQDNGVNDEEKAKEAIKSLVNFEENKEEMAQSIINDGGAGNILSSYDGKELTFYSGKFAYFLYHQ